MTMRPPMTRTHALSDAHLRAQGCVVACATNPACSAFHVGNTGSNPVGDVTVILRYGRTNMAE
jgi:hypothetical protein